MDSSRENEFLRMLSAFLDCDYNDKQGLTIEHYFVLFSIEIGHLDTFSDAETDIIGKRMKAVLDARILSSKAAESP